MTPFNMFAILSDTHVLYTLRLMDMTSMNSSSNSVYVVETVTVNLSLFQGVMIDQGCVEVVGLVKMISTYLVILL